MSGAPTIDPEFRDLITPLSEDEARGLEENILTYGCRTPLDVWRGVLVDGHHRLVICEKHGIEYHTAEIDLPDRRAVKVWIAKNQRDRRNVTPYQRAELGFVIEANLPGRQGERTDKTSVPNGTEVDKPSVAAPKAVGVSHTTYHKAKVIAAEASDDVKAKLRAGETTIGAEYEALTRLKKLEGKIHAALSLAERGIDTLAAQDPDYIVASGRLPAVNLMLDNWMDDGSTATISIKAANLKRALEAAAL